MPLRVIAQTIKGKKLRWNPNSYWDPSPDASGFQIGTDPAKANTRHWQLAFILFVSVLVDFVECQKHPQFL